MITIYIDGSSLGNPGKISIGYVMYKNEQLLKQEKKTLGIQTNNFAEYMAFIFALTDAIAMNERQCTVFSDSKLLCEQINGNYAVKNNNIYPLFMLSKWLISKLDFFTISHINRENNKDADRLAREAGK